MRASIRDRLASATREHGLDSGGRIRWLASQFENYLERWLAFCEMAEIPMRSLLRDDLLAAIEIGAEEFTALVSREDVSRRTESTWLRFSNALNDVRAGADRSEALRLREVFAEVKEALKEEDGQPGATDNPDDAQR